MLRRMAAVTGVLGLLTIILGATSAGLVETAFASGGGGCGGTGGGGPTPGPTQVFASHFSGLSASANFSSFSTDVNGDLIETDMTIDGFDGMVTLAATGPTRNNDVFASITITDMTTGVQPVAEFGCAANSGFHMDQAMTTAAVGPISVPLQDAFSGVSTTATVSASWTPAGPVTRQTQVSHFHSGAFTETFNFVGFDRFASVDGTVDDPDLGVSFAGPSTQGSFDKVNA